MTLEEESDSALQDAADNLLVIGSSSGIEDDSQDDESRDREHLDDREPELKGEID